MKGVEAKRLRLPAGRLLIGGERLRPVDVGSAAAAAPHQQAHVLPEGPGEQRVQEGVAQRVDGVEEDEQDLGVGHGDEGHAQGGRDGEEGDGRHAQEVGEDEHGHALGDLGVAVAGGVLRVAHAQVDADVAEAYEQEGDDVEEQHGHHVGLRRQRVDVHGQADADLAVAADAH